VAKTRPTIEKVEEVYHSLIRGSSLRVILQFIGGLAFFALVMVIDLIAHSVKSYQGTVLDIVRLALHVAGVYFWTRAFGPFFPRLSELARGSGKPETNTVPIRSLQIFTVSLAVAVGASFLPDLFTLAVQPDPFAPRTANVVLSFNILSATWAFCASILLVGFSKLVYLWQRTREVRRRLYTWLSIIGAFVIFRYLLDEGILASDTITDIINYSLIALVFFGTLFLWFRIPWIPHITKRSKQRVILYSGFAGALSIAGAIVYDGAWVSAIFHWYSPFLQQSVLMLFIALAAYFGLIFFNGLFTLSSTELVERRAAEVESLTKLTRFSSDVLTSELLLDIPKLTLEIATLAKEATKADAAWIELHTQRSEKSDSAGIPYRSYIGIEQSLAHELSEVPLTSRDRHLQGLTLSTEISGKLKPVLASTVYISNGAVSAYATGWWSVIGMPLINKGYARGAIYVAKQHEFGFDNEDVVVLTAFTDVASLAVDTARLLSDSIEKQKFDGELRAARAMQQSLLPAVVPEIPGFEVSAISIPAYEVGGDYYDFSTLWDGAPISLIGDVSGKGISASIFMAETKGIAQGLAPLVMSGKELLAGVNDTLMRNLQRDATHRSFVTLAAVSFHRDLVKYTRAGHTPLLHFSADGQYRYLQPKGMGIGFVKKEIFNNVLEEVEFALEKGDVIVLFSDGITEVRGADNDELGYQRFAEIVRAARFEPDVQKMTDRVLRDVLLYAGATAFSDDATFVIVRRL
jgi:phosphoserine phosphatase RsbU/P